MSFDSPSTHSLGTAIFWLCTAGVVYAYALYPLVILVLSRMFGTQPSPPPIAPDSAPTVTLLIAAHNEEAFIKQRIENALALNYPAARLKIVVASDGSDDRTNAIIHSFSGRIHPRIFSTRRGKTEVLNECLEGLDSDLVVLSDANTMMDADAIVMLARWFTNPAVGAVCGRLILTDPATGRNADSLYWRYETLLKTCEASLGGLLGANGAIYAIRRTLFQPLPPGTIVDDFVIPLRAKLAGQCRIVYDSHACAREEAAPDIRCEFARRARIGVGGWQALALLWPLLLPRHGWTAFTFWSHKVLRWACPFFMVGALASSLALAHQALFAAFAAAQIGFYTLCAAVAFLPGQRTWSRPARLCCMFGAMNLALLVGFFRFLRGHHSGAWQRTARTVAR